MSGHARQREELKLVCMTDLSALLHSAIFYPGGHGPCFDLPVDATSQKLIKDFYEAKMPVSAVCHAPAVFSDVKLSVSSYSVRTRYRKVSRNLTSPCASLSQNGKYLLETRKVTSFSNEEEEMAQLTDAIPWLVETRLGERGGMFSKAKAPFGEHVVVDESGDGHILITGQNPASASAMAKELTKALQK